MFQRMVRQQVAEHVLLKCTSRSCAGLSDVACRAAAVLKTIAAAARRLLHQSELRRELLAPRFQHASTFVRSWLARRALRQRPYQLLFLSVFQSPDLSADQRIGS